MIAVEDRAQAWLTLDLDALKANWRLLAERVAPAECAAVIKADAYGIGIGRAAPALARAGCRSFFVAHLTEGVRARVALREAGFADGEVRIFLLHGLLPGGVIHPDMLRFWLAPVLNAPHELRVWADHIDAAGHWASAAIQIDTGMRRVGLSPADLEGLDRALIEKTGATLAMSHFAAAEQPDNPENDRQIAAFQAARQALFAPMPASLANSSGCFLPQRPFFDLVRPGYALYGGNPCPGQPNPMQPVVTLRTAILQTRDVMAGEAVGYNGRWVAQRPSRLATIGVGYADGVPRGARTIGSGDGPVASVGGVLCPWVGRVSMDLSIVDVTDAPPDATTPGAPIELIGPHSPIDAFGAGANTIGYEILTGLGRRYHRTYSENT